MKLPSFSRGRALEKEPQTPKPKTMARTGGEKKEYFKKRERDEVLLRRLDTIYEQGGIISEALDQYPLAIMADGWRVEGDRRMVELVKDVYDQIDFESICWQGIVEGLKIGNGPMEICYGSGARSKDIVAVMPRAGAEFDILHDDRGIVSGYRQIVAKNAFSVTYIDIPPEFMIDVNLIPRAGSVYGMSLIQRALDDIMRDAKISEATSEAIDRHGFRRYHIRAGRPGETVPQEDIDFITNEFKKLSDNKTEITTQYDCEIKGLDEGELPAMSYFEWTTDRVCTSMGVPEEALGLGRGSTEATAKVRKKMFQTRVNTMKARLGRIFSLQLNDRITGKHGAAKLIFNGADVENELMIADLISKLMPPSDPWAIISPGWARKRMNIKDEEVVMEEDDSPEAKPVPPIPGEQDPAAVPGKAPNKDEGEPEEAGEEEGGDPVE